MTTSEQQAVPVAPFDAGAKALFDDTMAGRFAAPSARPSWREVDEAEKADWRGTVAAIIEAERLTSLPCKSGEGAGECGTCGGYGEYFGHADDCGSDSCALAGGIDDCKGQVLVCGCDSVSSPDATQTREAELPDDVRALVIAARKFWDDENTGSVRSHALDKALEPFSSRVPYDDEPLNARGGA